MTCLQFLLDVFRFHAEPALPCNLCELSKLAAEVQGLMHDAPLTAEAVCAPSLLKILKPSATISGSMGAQLNKDPVFLPHCLIHMDLHGPTCIHMHLQHVYVCASYINIYIYTVYLCTSIHTHVHAYVCTCIYADMRTCM